jgi:transposase-like protein
MKFTNEQKKQFIKQIKEATKKGITLAEASKSCDVTPAQYYAWVKKAQPATAKVFGPKKAKKEAIAPKVQPTTEFGKAFLFGQLYNNVQANLTMMKSLFVA